MDRESLRQTLGRHFPIGLGLVHFADSLTSAFHPLRTLGRAWLSSRKIRPGDFEVAPLLELIPPQTWPLDDECTEARAVIQGAQCVRLNDEPVTASLDFDEAVQSYCVEEIEFHGASIGRKNADVRFPPKVAAPD